MSLSTPLTFPCGFSQQAANENNLEPVLLKARCRRPVHTLSSDNLTITGRLKALMPIVATGFSKWEILNSGPKYVKNKQANTRDTQTNMVLPYYNKI